MAFTFILLICYLLIIIGYQLKENTETYRRRAAEEEAERLAVEVDELADKLSRSYSKVMYQTRGIMPELHKK